MRVHAWFGPLSPAVQHPLRYRMSKYLINKELETSGTPKFFFSPRRDLAERPPAPANIGYLYG